MSIVDFSSKLAAVNRAYQTAFDGLRDDPPGTYQLFTQVDGAPTGTSANIGFTDPLAPLRVLARGESKIFDDMRALGASYDMEVLYKGTTVSRRDVEHDLTGRVSRGLQRFVSEGVLLVDERAWQLLLANTLTGPDGVALLSDSHPFGSGGATWDNLTTDALSFSSYNAAKAAMRNFKRENGTPYNVSPTHLFVGPDLERTAKEIVGADRPVPFSATAQDATSGIVAATAIGNVYQGDVTVVVVPWITDAQEWLLMDLGKATARPWYAQIAPIREEMPEEGDTVIRQRDEFEYAINCDVIMGPGHPQLIYGRLDS